MREREIIYYIYLVLSNYDSIGGPQMAKNTTLHSLKLRFSNRRPSCRLRGSWLLRRIMLEWHKCILVMLSFRGNYCIIYLRTQRLFIVKDTKWNTRQMSSMTDRFISEGCIISRSF